VIHRLAHIDSGARVHEHAFVWQFASVIRCARVGEDSSIGAGAVVDGAFVGDRCSIGSGANLNPGTFIADDCFVGPHAVVCNDPWPRAERGDFDMDELLSGARVTVHIERGASVGAGAIILPGVSIGEDAMIAAGAVVTRSVAAGHLCKRSGQQVPIDNRERNRSVHVAYLHDVVGRQRKVV
jgi:acetyltransferase-like isoleucine patch superfamily enzyme